MALRGYACDVLAQSIASHEVPDDAQKKIADSIVMFNSVLFGASHLGSINTMCSNVDKVSCVKVDPSKPRDNVYQREQRSIPAESNAPYQLRATLHIS